MPPTSPKTPQKDLETPSRDPRTRPFDAPNHASTLRKTTETAPNRASDPPNDTSQQPKPRASHLLCSQTTSRTGPAITLMEINPVSFSRVIRDRRRADFASQPSSFAPARHPSRPRCRAGKDHGCVVPTRFSVGNRSQFSSPILTPQHRLARGGTSTLSPTAAARGKHGMPSTRVGPSCSPLTPTAWRPCAWPSFGRPRSL